MSMMQSVLRPYIDKFVLVYLDDILEMLLLLTVREVVRQPQVRVKE
jgi:hypothetical protein